jgi:hypothetical protein
MMAVRHLEVGVRREPGAAVLDLRGEINGFAQEVLDAAYTEAEKGKLYYSTSRALTTSTRQG